MKPAADSVRPQSPTTGYPGNIPPVWVILLIAVCTFTAAGALSARTSGKTPLISDKEILTPKEIAARAFPGLDPAGLSSRGDLVYGDSEWVLADPGTLYFAYGKSVDKIGVKNLPGGVWQLVWCDMKSGETFSQQIVAVLDGDYMFGKPANIGNHTIVYIFNARDAHRPPGL